MGHNNFAAARVMPAPRIAHTATSSHAFVRLVLAIATQQQRQLSSPPPCAAWPGPSKPTQEYKKPLLGSPSLVEPPRACLLDAVAPLLEQRAVHELLPRLPVFLVLTPPVKVVEIAGLKSNARATAETHDM